MLFRSSRTSFSGFICPPPFALRDSIIPPGYPLFKKQNRPDFATFVTKTETNRNKTATNRNFQQLFSDEWSAVFDTCILTRREMQAQLHTIGVKVWQRHGKLPKKYGKSVNTAKNCQSPSSRNSALIISRYRNRKDIMTCVPCGFCTESKSFRQSIAYFHRASFTPQTFLRVIANKKADLFYRSTSDYISEGILSRRL